MKKVRFGVIGLGVIGQQHLEKIADLKTTEVTAVCDIDQNVSKATASKYGCASFTKYPELLKERICDAILIATPHYQHTPIGIDALKAGYHVLIEKPLSVHKADCERLLSVPRDKNQIFAIMLNLRTDLKFKKAKRLIADGELGNITRVNWIVTDWFRTDAYYGLCNWRATWEGEGGGVLLNQCPHQIDMLIWLCGMPSCVRGFCGLGKQHKIEVEDEVTAYFEYPNGATGVFIASTGEAPGTNRLEICGDLGKILIENNKIIFTKNEISASDYIRTSKELFSRPQNTTEEEILENNPLMHRDIIENFSNAILFGEKLIAPAEEGIYSVELANAILYSSLIGRTVDIPIDSRLFEKQLLGLIEASRKNGLNVKNNTHLIKGKTACI